MTASTDPQFGDTRLPDRFWKKVSVQPDGCWEWQAMKTSNGYGSYYLDGRMRRAHRVVHEALIGPIADGLLVLHACDNPPCVNPGHLHSGTPSQNMWEKVERGRHVNGNTHKTRCVNGHEFTPENTYHRPDKSGRHCKTCKTEALRRYSRRNIGVKPKQVAA